MVKGTGYIRRIDDRGGIIIPKSLIEKINTKEYQPMEFLIDEENGLIIMKKFDDSYVVEME